MYKTKLTAVERRTAKDKVLAPQLKLILYPLYTTKPNKLCLARIVGNIDNKSLIASLAKEILTRYACAYLDIATLTIRLVKLTYLVDLGAINISKWKVVQHITHRAHTNLLCK